MRATSSVEMAFGSRLPWAGGRTSADASASARPSAAQNRCQPRTAATDRAVEDADRARRRRPRCAAP